MRVWLINHYALPPSEPGGTRHYTLARQLIRNGHEVTIIASSFNHVTGKQMGCSYGKRLIYKEFGGVPFLILRVPEYHNNIARLWNMFVFAFKVWLGLGTKTMRKPDVVIGSSLTLFAAFASERLARRLDIPFVLEIRDLWPQTLIDMGMSPYHPAVIGFGIIERYLYRNANQIVTLLPNASEHMVTRGARSSDITWIPNGVDLELMPLPQIPTLHKVFLIMYTGSHGLSDALDSILDAARILNDEAPGRFCFRFIGDGPNKFELRNKAETENLANVVFDKPVPKEQVFSTLQEADAFVITAKKTDLYRYGISPNKLHEYMAAARPTIFAANSHNNPIAEAAAGITVAPEDPEAIVAAIKTLANLTSDQRWEMGLRGRRYIEARHDLAELAGRLEAVLRSTLTPSDEVQNGTPGITNDCESTFRVEDAHIQ